MKNKCGICTKKFKNDPYWYFEEGNFCKPCVKGIKKKFEDEGIKKDYGMETILTVYSDELQKCMLHL